MPDPAGGFTRMAKAVPLIMGEALLVDPHTFDNGVYLYWTSDGFSSEPAVPLVFERDIPDDVLQVGARVDVELVCSYATAEHIPGFCWIRSLVPESEEEPVSIFAVLVLVSGDVISLRTMKYVYIPDGNPPLQEVTLTHSDAVRSREMLLGRRVPWAEETDTGIRRSLC